jgi:mannose-6-phosphate isomerase-like protein (cupin superfamily)
MKITTSLFSVPAFAALTLFCQLFHVSTVQADILNLSEITIPSGVENIHVHKISSDAHSSDFVIFIKKMVPLHKHLKHTETIYVLEGRGIFQQGDEHTEIGPGDYLRIPEGTPHAVKVLSSEPLKVLSVQAPEFLGKDRVFIETP